ncbi:MBOAT, membrane-bound O-acyltransferase family-domain-containing protein [Microdochium bolleyi]|uniref:MBOAT, membrane-bound O-acyltransferase family-domain-containing protein n=1 Tax=Microdochium bolleyi TaxID=196109 RepID=A0A136JBM9_9PEZI|nr:MBOAT, membrane-bound O-acyltransferase family-domain-containing protein [Microdochium bolleyi]
MLPYINYPFEYLSGMLGSPPDDLKLIFSFLLSYPLAGLLKRVPDSRPDFKNIFIISISLFYLVGLFSLWGGLRTLFIASAGTYGLAHFLRTSPYMPWIAFVFLMGHMAVNQLERQFAGNPETMDITGTQMVLVMKLSAFAWNVFDGTLPDSELSELQRARKIVQMPSILDYAAYVLFFPSLLIGPAFDYNEYRGWIDTSMFTVPATVDPTKKPPTRHKRKIPRSGTPAMWTMASGLAYIFLFLQFGARFYPEWMLDDKFLQHSLLRRIFYLHMVGLTVRFKYYGAWLLAEGSCILAGLGYNGVDPKTGKVSWNRLQNVSPWGVETATNSRGYLENWNMNTNKWLRNYIYLRVTPKGKKPGFRASMATFVTSAFWHGFYPGYYLTFILASFVQTAAKNMRRHVRPFFLDPNTQEPLPTKQFYDIASWLATQLVFSFAVAPFYLLTLPKSLLVWSRVYFYAVVIVFAGIAFFSSPGKVYLKKALEERSRKAGVAQLKKSASTESLTGHRPEPVLGLNDPVRDVDDAIRELKEAGLDSKQVKAMVEEAIREKQIGLKNRSRKA